MHYHSAESFCVRRLNLSLICPKWKCCSSNVFSLNNDGVAVDVDVDNVSLIKTSPSWRTLNCVVAQRFSQTLGYERFECGASFLG